MGDEDWDEELGSTSVPSFVPNFKNLDSQEDVFSCNRSMGSQGSRNEWNETEGGDNRSRGFSSGSGFGNQRGSRNEWNEAGRGDNRSLGFLSGSGFGNRRDDAQPSSSENGQPGNRRGFGSFGRREDNENEDGQSRRTGFENRGFGERSCSSDSNRRGRGGTGPSRGGGRGFGQRQGDDSSSQDSGFGSKRGFGNQGGGGNSSWGQGDTFGSKRGGFGSQTGDCDGARGSGRSGFGGSRGGYKGKDEEIMSGSSSEKAPWKSDAEEGGGDIEAPRVTYIPPPPPEEEDTIFAHYQTGINFDKYDEILVNVTGQGVPPAILTFEEAGLCETLNRNIAKTGYVKPTPVQKHAIPIVLAGRDLMACAQTGSGKTAAFILPILAQMMQDGVSSSQFQELQEPEAIIVAPTRELINQIYLEARKFAFGTCVRPVVVYGGISTGYCLRQIFQGCNILCATPGRLLDIIGKGKIGLSKVKYLVLDEADRMLDMGFIPDIRKLVTSPAMPTKEERQTLMFSATFPEVIQRLAAEFLRTDYLFVAVGQVGGACSDVQQTIAKVEYKSKRNKLHEILQDIGTERTMVFVATKKQADFIATFLCQENIPTTSIHGDREQREREEALRDFRSGKCPVLVATSVAARGLDIENVQHVINFDLPENIDEYVHRIGRTGRCGNIGKAISFFDPTRNDDVNIARSLVKVLSDAHQDVPAWLEEIAFGAHGTTYSNPRGKVFSSVDSRQEFGGNRNFSTIENSAPVVNEEEDSWD